MVFAPTINYARWVRTRYNELFAIVKEQEYLIGLINPSLALSEDYIAEEAERRVSEELAQKLGEDLGGIFG
tara:strand:+ start:197 stop:409 length:213 start_codon:yes stop_codon:yes gene_type:complete